MKKIPDLGFWKLWNISFGFFGVQIAYALQSANISRIFSTLGADPHSLSYFWILPPLAGIIVQPIIGALSDRTWTRFGRRIPYLFAGALVAVCVMCLLSGQMSGCPCWLPCWRASPPALSPACSTPLWASRPSLSGILTQLALYSINLKIMGKANQSINVDKYDLLISLRWVKELALHNPIIMVILVSAVVIGVLYWFFGTELGCGIRATGSNPAMSRAQGINTSFNVVLGLAVSNGLVALSGALLSQYQGFADVSMGRGAIVIGLAAVIIGEALFSRIFHNFALKLVSVSLGAIIYYIVIQLVLTLGFDANLLKLLSASVVAVFLAVPYWKGKYFSKPVKKAKEDAKNA